MVAHFSHFRTYQCGAAQDFRKAFSMHSKMKLDFKNGMTLSFCLLAFLIFKLSCHLLLPAKPLKDRGNPVKCLAQGHNK